MINFWKLSYEAVKKQRDQLKVELQQCKSELHHYKAELESYKTNLKQRKEALEYTRDEVKKYKAERDSLIDDIAVLKEKNISRLERENEEKTKVIILYKKAYEKAHKGWFRYRELTNHIRLKAENNPGVSRYIDLVNYIDRLERADDER